jgi:hypothetical protein
MLRITPLPRDEAYFGLALSDARRKSCPFPHRVCANEFRDFEIAGQGKRRSGATHREENKKSNRKIAQKQAKRI